MYICIYASFFFCPSQVHAYTYRKSAAWSPLLSLHSSLCVSMSIVLFVRSFDVVCMT